MKIATFLRRHLFELPQFPVLKSIGHGNRKGIVQQFDGNRSHSPLFYKGGSVNDYTIRDTAVSGKTSFKYSKHSFSGD
ncbi:MAG: hypothetical protein GY801_12595 [bacterium]|nr:hypothetical protein [bacterium]